jgi:rSAM/selenodomain-associated transferase 2
VLSVIIPTFNAADTLGATLAALAEARVARLRHELVVSDGGSADATLQVAQRGGARIVTGNKGRGVQLRAGASAAAGDWLLFLHADTRLAPGWVDTVERFRAGSGAARRAAYFRFTLDADGAAARRIEALVRWRCAALALPYGDQGLLISRALYDEIGGYQPLPLMEDVDIVRRLGRARLVALDHDAVTSAARYRRDGWWLRPLRNLACLSLYFLGVKPARLVRFYR